MPLSPEQRAKCEAVCERVANGMSLRQATSGKDAPCSHNAFREWRHADETGDIDARYLRAREERVEVRVEEIRDIADDPDLDPNDKRVRILARQWEASKLHPARYGDKQTIDLNHGVQDPDGILAKGLEAAARLGLTLPTELLGRLGQKTDKDAGE